MDITQISINEIARQKRNEVCGELGSASPVTMNEDVFSPAAFIPRDIWISLG